MTFRNRILLIAAALAGFALATASATDTKVPAGDAASAPEAQRPLMGEDFVLRADEVDVELIKGEVKTLHARINASMTMDTLSVVADRLEYDGATLIMRAWGTPERRCIVVREGVTTECDEFHYNTQTRETQVIGDPRIKIDRGDSKIAISGDDVKIQQAEGGEAGGPTTIVVTGNSKFGSRGTKPPVGNGEEPNKLEPPVTLAPRATPLPRPTPRPTIRQTPKPTPTPAPAPRRPRS